MGVNIAFPYLQQQLRGSLFPFLQSEAWDFDPTRGYLHIYDFKGASPDLMLAQQQDIVRGNIACRLTFEQGGNARLDVTDSTMQYTIDVWQIVGNMENRDALSNPLFLPDVTSNFGVLLAAIRQHLADQDSADVVSQDPAFAELNDNDFAQLLRVYTMLLAGQTEYRREQYVVRHTTNCSNVFPVNIADTGIGRIYTPADFFSEAQDSGLWILPLPSNMAYALANVPSPLPIPFYLWGFLKGSPTRTSSPNNRVDIVTEYTLEHWSVDEYEPLDI
jgi:hypothetical protein